MEANCLGEALLVQSPVQDKNPQGFGDTFIDFFHALTYPIARPNDFEKNTMTTQQQRVQKYRFTGLLLAIGLLLLASVLFEESPLAMDIPLDPDGIQRAVVEADSYAFIPNHLTVNAGKPVALTFKSVTWVVPHNVIIDDPRSGLNIREEIPAGESLTITFTPTVPGSFPIYCDKKLPFFKSHREKGQEGVLEVR
jgi:plastocyanin